MKNADFEKKLQQALHQVPMADNGHLKHTLLLAEKEAYRRHERKRISFPRFLSLQIRFMGWKIWFMQGIFLLIISGIVVRTYGRYFFENPQFLTRLLFCLSVLVSMTALPFIYRSVRYQMQEVEAASYFSAVKLLMAKLALIGIGDISMLTVIFIATIAKTSLPADSAILYLCLPFLLVTDGCLFLLGHFSPKHFKAGSLGLCSFFILMCIALPGHYRFLFQQSFSMGWMAVCGLLVVFCIKQLHYILYHSSYTEMQIA